MYIFGSGDAFFTPLTNTAPQPTPMQLYALQECSVDFAFGSKPMMGKQQFPLALARTEGKVSIKAKFGNAYLKVWNDVFFGATVAAGQEIGIPREAHNGAASITITPPGGGTFVRDLGVQNATTGKQLTLITTAPAVGQYEVNAGTGVYTFNASEGNVFISYTYTSTTGFKSAVTNQAMGSMPVGQFIIMNAQYQNLDGSINCLVRLPAVIGVKITLPNKFNDWQYTEIDLEAFADASNNIMYLNADE